jgi:LysR family transcriptional regulator, glycine cleavage system transcriptional activator
MASRLPPLNPLKSFEAVGRHKSVGGAARELGVTASAISHQVRSLENSLGYPVMVREAGRVALTPQGRALLPAISTAFEIIAEAAARAKHPSAASRLAISCAPAFLGSWLIPRLSDFTRRYPDLDLSVVGSNSARDIYAADVDLCIRYGDGNWPDCWVHLLAPLRLFPVISPWLDARLPLRNPSDLARHMLLHSDDGKEWHIWLTATGSSGAAGRRAHFLPDAQLALEAAVHGVGVALGDNVTANGSLVDGQLLAPFDVEVPAIDGLFFACRTGMQFAPIVAAFIDWVTDRMGADAVASAWPSGASG